LKFWGKSAFSVSQKRVCFWFPFMKRDLFSAPSVFRFFQPLVCAVSLPVVCAQEPPAQLGSGSVPTAPASEVSATAGSALSALPPKKASYSRCNVEGPQVALTFDDGPHATNTPRLLDLLKERNVKATFFLVGTNVEAYPDIVKRIVSEGHEVASHSLTHPNLGKMAEGSVTEQLERTHRAIKTACGVDVVSFRPPYGSFTVTQRAWAASRFGYRTILWDVDPLDWKVRDSAKVEAEILRATTPGSIVLMHDIHKTTVDAVPAVIKGLSEKGLQFVTVSALVAMDKGGESGTGGAPAAPATKSPSKPAVKSATESKSKSASTGKIPKAVEVKPKAK
jgi:peptidoglycan/xylan/chitin deacetylase (PgdA/CDA1 family)